MNGMEDPLTIIPPSEWPKLLTKFSGTSGLTATISIKTQIILKKDFEDFPVTIYAPYNNPDSGIVIIWRLVDFMNEVAVYSMNDDLKILSEAIRNTKYINWNISLRFATMMFNVFNSVNEILTSFGFSGLNNHTYFAYVCPDKAKKFDTSLCENIRIETIGPEYASEIDEEWPHRYPGSIKYFECMLKYGLGLAILGNENNDLRGWTFISPRGDIHALQIKTEHRNKGYGSLLVRILGKKLGDDDRDVSGFIVTKNIPSQRMFTKLGFEFLSIVEWIDYRKEIKN